MTVANVKRLPHHPTRSSMQGWLLRGETPGSLGTGTSLGDFGSSSGILPDPRTFTKLFIESVKIVATKMSRWDVLIGNQRKFARAEMARALTGSKIEIEWKPESMLAIRFLSPSRQRALNNKDHAGEISWN